MTKQHAISHLIIRKAEELAAANGNERRDNIRAALDFVCGAGAYDRLASDLYDKLRQRAA